MCEVGIIAGRERLVVLAGETLDSLSRVLFYTYIASMPFTE